jgi:predicted DNA-binding transcriptional regulator YafY
VRKTLNLTDNISWPIEEGFFEQKNLEISYRDLNGKLTERNIEPQYLLLAMPVWYLLAWDNLREDVRSFRLDRIVNAEVTTSSFCLKKELIFEKLMVNIGVAI